MSPAGRGVYELIPHEEGEVIRAMNPSDWDLVRDLPEGASAALDVKVVEGDEKVRHRERVAFPWFVVNAIVMSELVPAALSQSMAFWGSTVNLTSPGRALRLFSPRVIDALAENASQIVRFPSSGRIMAIKNPVFIGEKLPQGAIFRIPQIPRSTLYLAEDAVTLIDGFGLPGVHFRKAGYAV